MADTNLEWYNKLVLGGIDKDMIHGDLEHKYVDASIYSAVLDETNNCYALVKGIYKLPESGDVKCDEIAATSEEAYRDYISGSMLVCMPSPIPCQFVRATGIKFDLTTVSNNGASPVMIVCYFGGDHVGSPGAGPFPNKDFEIIECKTKEFYTAT